MLAPRDVVHSDKQNQPQHTPISASAWLRIGQLFEAALARPLEERASYLEKNCCEQPEICWEVLSLLKSAETAGSFLDNPAMAWSAQRLTLEHGYKLGQFEVLEVIGRGGMGDVYRARDLRLQREVALKVLPPAFACDPERVLRFEREAKAAGSLSHPNVVHIYDVGRTDGNWWIASEFVEGCSLDRVTERGAIAWRRAVEIAAQIAHGLAAAHAAGVIHRDLTPRNIMVTPEDGIKILDFGTAKLDYAISAATGSFAAEISGTGLIIGSPGYMAPEQVIGRPADARSDIFALGVVLYEMLSGLRAFKRSSAIETMSATIKEEPPDLPGAIPAPVRRITRRCLDKAANQRFQSAADVGFALAALLGEDVDVNDAPAMAAKHGVSPKWIILAGTVAILIMGASYWASTRANKPAAPPELVLRRLTLDSGLTTDGAISPDGKLVAFASDRGNANNLNIWVKQLDGAGAAVRLTNNAADDYDPAFSPDGTQIAYRSELEGGGSRSHRGLSLSRFVCESPDRSSGVPKRPLG